MWSGSIAAIPPGWGLCDGTRGTPDLRNRFVVCADADVSGVANSTVTGAAAQSGDGQLISHTHAAGTFSESAHTHGLWIPGAGVTKTRPETFTTGASDEYQTESGGSGTITGTSGATGSGVKNVAVFYALAFIMKL